MSSQDGSGGQRGGKRVRQRLYPEARPPRGAHTGGMSRESHATPGFSLRRDEDLVQEGMMLAGGWAGMPGLELCRPATPGTPDEVLYGPLDFDAGAHTVAIYPSGTGTWPVNSIYASNDGNPPGADGGGKVGWGNTAAGSGPESPKLPATAGVTYRYDVSAYCSSTGTGSFIQVAFYDSITPSATLLGTQVIVAWDDLAASTWEAFSVEATAPANTAFMQMQTPGGWGFGVNSAYDLVTVTALTGTPGIPNDGHADLVGSADDRAARCDHRHDVHRDTAPTVNDDWATAGYKLGTIWAQLDDLTTPTEVVGIWMLVDVATGAAVWLWIGGLTEAEVQALIDATLATHVAAGDPHPGYRLESADHTHASTGLQGGTVDHGVLTGLADDDHTQYLNETRHDALGHGGVGVGELMISDTPSTPLVFADILQNEAQDDLLYADA